MSRYNNSGSNGSNGSNDYDDDITLKLQDYACISLEPARLNAFNGNWGDVFIAGIDHAEVVDGIVFQRDDDENTWKVFSADDIFNLNPDDGLVYEKYDEEAGEYVNQMSAQDVLDHPRVRGFQERHGGDPYYYTPVGVVIEEAGETVTNDELDVTVTDDGKIEVGEASMLLPNSSWVRTLAKKLTAQGEAFINDNGADDPDDNPKYEDFEWMTTLEPDLRPELEGRELELWITEETADFEDGSQTYSTPNLLDVKTGEFVTIENGIEESDSDDGRTNNEAGQDAAQDHDEPAADPEPKAADGGTTAQTATQDTSSTTETTTSPESDNSPESTQEPSTDSTDDEPHVPAVLDDLIGYFARTDGQVDPAELREMAEDEVDDPDAVDWDAAAQQVEEHPQAN